MKRTLVAALAVMLLLAPIAPFVAVGGVSAAPAGMATIPDGNVAEEVPDGESLTLSASELEGGVLASDHADSLEVVLTTADHAPSVMDGDAATVSGNGMAVVLRDDQFSAGREVAIDAGQLQEALGYRPKAIRGTHEDGSEWTRSAEYDDGYLVFEVPHFSSNVVTFSGEISLSGTPTNNTAYNYDLSSTDSVNDFQINLTGQETTQWDNVSGTGATPGTTQAVDIGGNLDPVGPTDGPELTLTASEIVNMNGLFDRDDRDIILAGASSEGQYESESYITNAPDKITAIEFDVTNVPNSLDGDEKVDIFIYDGKNMNTYVAGSSYAVATWDVPADLSTGTVRVPLDSPYDPAGSDITIDMGSKSFEASSGEGLTFEAHEIADADTRITTRDGGTGGWYETSSAAGIRLVSGASDVSVDANGETYSYGNLSDGESKTKQLSLDTTDTSLTINSAGGSFDYSLAMKERAVTEDPQVSVNGNSVSHGGVLSDGETTTLSTNAGWLKSGTNTVTVTFDRRYSPDSPTPTVGFEYSHEATDSVVVDYNAAEFFEAYNVTHTYADATDNATATVPFDNSRITALEYVEVSVNDGAWSAVDPADYELDGTTLTVDLAAANGGAISSGTTVEVRTRGRSVETQNGAITVVDPTRPSEEYETQVRVDSRSEGFAINVGPTDQGDRVHYAFSDDYETSEYSIIKANGDQLLHLPNAATNDQLHVTAVNTEINAKTGDVRVEVVEPGQNPELDISPGPRGQGDEIEIKYYDTQTGTKYILESLVRSIVVDSDTAESPAIFEDDDSDDLWQILADSTGTSDGDGGGAIGQFRRTASTAAGSISLPIDGAGLGQLALVGLLGIGGIVALRRLGSGSATEGGAAETVETTGRGLTRLGRLGGSAASTVGRGLRVALDGLLSYVSSLIGLVLASRRATIALGVGAAIVAARLGLLQLPAGAGILIVVSGVPLATYLVLRRTGTVSQRVWLASTLAAVVLGLEFVAPGTLQTAIEQLTSEQVAPLLILVGAGGLYLWYRVRQSDRPVFNVVTRRE